MLIYVFFFIYQKSSIVIDAEEENFYGENTLEDELSRSSLFYGSPTWMYLVTAVSRACECFASFVLSEDGNRVLVEVNANVGDSLFRLMSCTFLD